MAKDTPSAVQIAKFLARPCRSTSQDCQSSSTSGVRRDEGGNIAFELWQHGLDRIRILINRLSADNDRFCSDYGVCLQKYQHLLRASVGSVLDERRGVAGVIILSDHPDGSGFAHLDLFDGACEAGVEVGPDGTSADTAQNLTFARD